MKSMQELTKQQYLEVEKMIKDAVLPISEQITRVSETLCEIDKKVDKIKPASMLASAVAGSMTSTIITIMAWLKSRGLI